MFGLVSSKLVSFRRTFRHVYEIWRKTADQEHIHVVVPSNFTITAEIHARSLVLFYCPYADRHMHLKFMRSVSKRERAIRQFVILKNKLMSVFNASVLLLTVNFVITCQSSLRIHSAIASWIHSYFDNVMTKFMINKRIDA